ncbi:MAG: ROK family protein [Lentisphaeria bacterium]|jgi:glucokinase
MSHETLYLGLDIGGTKSAAIVGTATGTIRERAEWPSLAHQGLEPMLATILETAAEMAAKHPGLAAVGVSIGGPLDAKDGVIQSPPNLPGWDNVPLKSILAERLSLPVQVGHDAAACALAECCWGAAQGLNRVAYLTCGTGFGIGLVFDGKIYCGAHGHNCEIGHARYAEDGPVAFGKAGSFEAYCAGSALGRIAAWKFPNLWPKAPPSEEISKLAKGGHPEARQVVAINARAVGRACALIADMLFPDIIILGSLANHLGKLWLDQVQDAFAAEALPAAHQACRIAPSALGKRLQDFSALAVACRGGQ